MIILASIASNIPQNISQVSLRPLRQVLYGVDSWRELHLTDDSFLMAVASVTMFCACFSKGMSIMLPWKVNAPCNTSKEQDHKSGLICLSLYTQGQQPSDDQHIQLPLHTFHSHDKHKTSGTWQLGEQSGYRCWIPFLEQNCTHISAGAGMS